MAEIRVWDPFVRVFHWTLVIAFFTAFLSGDDWQAVHVIAGYTVGGLILARLVWGFVGTRHARFSDFLYRPSEIRTYLRELLTFSGKRYVGHSPAGGVMIFALLFMISLIVVSGLFAYALREGAGPLAGWIVRDRAMGRFVGEVHEVLADLTFGLVLVHIAAVLLLSLLHGENLVKAMWTGRKKAAPSD